MKTPYTRFNYPRQTIVGVDYVPPKTRNPEERERRHYMPGGTLLAEKQRDGLLITASILRNIHDEPDVAFATSVLGAAMARSAEYQFVRDARVMSRYAQVPHHVVLADHEPPTVTERLAVVRARVERVAEVAGKFVTMKQERRVGQVGQSLRLGRMMGDIALDVACAPLVDQTSSCDPFTAQAIVREECIGTLDRIGVLGQQIGTLPSIAQLADPNSDLAVHIRRAAPDGVFEAFEQASVQFAAAQ